MTAPEIPVPDTACPITIRSLPAERVTAVAAVTTPLTVPVVVAPSVTDVEEDTVPST